MPGSSTEAGASRRTSPNAALGVGYAATAMPITAQTAIKTSVEGPKNGQTIFDVADTARRFAKAGYLAIAPELYARQGEPTKYTEMTKLMSEVVARVPDEQGMADLDGAVKWAGAYGGNLRKVGITGFCWGGRITWLNAEQSKNVKAGVAWYGRLVGQPSALTPRHPVDLAAGIMAPVLGLYGGQDGGIPLTTVNQMKDALADAGSEGNEAAQASEFAVYKDAPHAFHADYRSSYRKAAADDSFARGSAVQGKRRRAKHRK